MIKSFLKNKIIKLLEGASGAKLSEFNDLKNNIDDLKKILLLESNTAGYKTSMQVLPPVHEILDNNTFNLEIYSEQNKMAYQLIQDSYPLAFEQDTKSIPLPEDREGYYDDRHLEYWVSGFSEYMNVNKSCQRLEIELRGATILDIGCSSGRFLRHIVSQCENASIYGCDVNVKTIHWLNTYFGDKIFTFQNTAIASLPFQDNNFEVITAFSVFTHIWHSIDAWILELYRIIKSGGLVYITVQTETTWKNMKKNNYVIYQNLKKYYPEAFNEDSTFEDSVEIIKPPGSVNAYNAQVFISRSYIRKKWGNLFKVVDILEKHSEYQDVILLQKTV